MKSPFTLHRGALVVLAASCFFQDVVGRRAAMGGRGRRSRMLESLMQQPADDSPPPADAKCPDAYGKPITAEKTNVWLGLSGEETATVVEWLFEQEGLNLTVSEDAGEWDNQILAVDIMPPNKTDVLPYLDGDGALPTKYARAILDNRATDKPTYQDIIIGPLPITNSTTWSPLEYPLTRKTQGKVQNLDADIDTLYTQWLEPIGTSIADITMDLWGGTCMGLDNDTLEIWGIDPLWQEDDRIYRWDSFWTIAQDGFHAGTLLPLGLFFKSDVTGRDPSKWKIEGWLYDDRFFETTEEFREAYWGGELEKLGANVEGKWSGTDRRGKRMVMDDAKPPVAVAPSGSRYSVDYENRYVEWMGFSFYVGFSRDTGVTLYDIKFQGKRVLYELGLQEALAHYAGNDPVQSGTAYLDSYYGFGPYTFELVKDYDCPAYATYLNTTFYVRETTHTHIDSLCLFEFTADHPIQRHTTSWYVSATKNTQLTLRYVAVMGNYDYTFSYTFSLDGMIGVDVRASGYIQSAYFAHNEDYGFKIHDNLSGSMHDHVLNFKADFDIYDARNSVHLMKVVPTTETYKWSKTPRKTMKLESDFVATEHTSRLDWDANLQTMVMVVNMDERTEFGEYRGYRIHPSTPGAHLTVQDSSILDKAAGWSTHDVQITRQKDTEPRSAHCYNNQDVHDPPIDFDAFFDGESLLQEDLVVWLNVGMHHVPNTGDLPNTVMTNAHASLQFIPNNFLDSDASRRTANMVRIVYDAGEVEEVEEFRQGRETCANEYRAPEVDFWAYKGDVVVRKFPYDPNDPYYETESIP